MFDVAKDSFYHSGSHLSVIVSLAGPVGLYSRVAVSRTQTDFSLIYVAARRHILVCFMAKSAFWRGFSALAPYTGVGPI